MTQPPNPKLDLVFERIVDVAPELVWRAWTTPEHLKIWFAPRPWTTSRCEIDLKPGGKFLAVMCSPEGKEQLPKEACYLEIVPNRRLVWTTVMQAGYRPNPPGDSATCGPPCTVIITLEPHGNGTKYLATVLHSDEEARAKHEAMGFHEGWGAAFNQLVELVKTTKP